MLRLLPRKPDCTDRALRGRVSNSSYLGSLYECDFTVGQIPLRIGTTLPLDSIANGEVWAELVDTRYAAFSAA